MSNKTCLCPVLGCDKAYTYPSGLSYHISRMHEELRAERKQLRQETIAANQFPCLLYPICQTKLCSISSRNKHFHAKHSDLKYAFLFKCEDIQFIALMEFQHWQYFLNSNVYTSGMYMAQFLRCSFRIDGVGNQILCFNDDVFTYTGDLVKHIIQSFLFRSYHSHVRGREAELINGLSDDRLAVFRTIQETYFVFTTEDWVQALQL